MYAFPYSTDKLLFSPPFWALNSANVSFRLKGLANSRWIYPKLMARVLTLLTRRERLSLTFYSPSNSMGKVSASSTRS